MKECNYKDHCGERLIPKLNFRPSRSNKDGLMNWCRSCVAIYDKEYRERNKGKKRQQAKAWQLNNKDAVNARSTKYRAANPEKRKQTCYASSQKYYWAHRAEAIAKVRARQSYVKQATPSWTSKDAILEVYRLADKLTADTGVTHHVHHIVPLRENILVCGLHCPDNLQVLTDAEHRNLHSGSRISRYQGNTQ